MVLGIACSDSPAQAIACGLEAVLEPQRLTDDPSGDNGSDHDHEALQSGVVIVERLQAHDSNGDGDEPEALHDRDSDPFRQPAPCSETD
jgi:hypothetical protein